MRRQRVLVLGSGPAGLSAAQALSAPGVRDSFDVTVIDVGWRSGGKCTSGRYGPEQRLELNGTHYIFGCYDNAVDLIRLAYEELNAAGDFRSGRFEDQLLPRNRLIIKQFFKGNWTSWTLDVPPNGLRPGTAESRLNPWDILERLVKHLFGIWDGSRALAELTRTPLKPDSLLETVEAKIGGILRGVADSHPLQYFRSLLDKATSSRDMGTLSLVLRSFRHWLWWLVKDLVEDHLELTRLWILADTVVTLTVGLIEDGGFEVGGLDRLDRFELREWLERWGATDITVWSPLVMTWYDSVAAYEDGDPQRPNMSASIAIKAWVMALVFYRGSLAYQLARELGESLVAPVVQMLKNRGVKFRYFTRVWDIVPQGKAIGEIQIEEQVQLRSGDPCSYQPFAYLRVPGQDGAIRVWPGEPDQTQIATPDAKGLDTDNFYAPAPPGGRTMRTLRQGVDFDLVVFAMPGPTARFYCQKLLSNPAWQGMVNNTAFSETQSLRLYHRQTVAEMGLPGPPSIVSAYAQPFTTWEDAGQLAAFENWPADEKPQAVSTIYGSLPSPLVPPGPEDVGYPARQQAVVDANALQFCRHDVGPLWPCATSVENPIGIDWNTLIDPLNRQGEARLKFQDIKANVGPVAGYTRGPAGGLSTRLPAGKTDFDNLFVAGDWSRNGVDVGSIEGAVISGILCAADVTGKEHVTPTPSPIFDPPPRK